MIARATVDAMIDRARATQARVDRGDVDGRDPDVQAECREALATADAYVAGLPEAMRSTTATVLVARLEAPASRFTPTVQPRRAERRR